MAGRKERFQPFSSTDDWLEKKKQSDGAEGLWRIHDKLYDFTVWSRKHPGGKFWIDKTRGTDITEAFESHHFSNEPTSLLENFYKRKAKNGGKSVATFGGNSFHREFKRKVSREKFPAENKFLFQFDILVVAVFLTALAGVHEGIYWIGASGILLGILSISSHSFLHGKHHWRVNYFNLSLMSSNEWKVRHVLSHHQYPNTDLDLEARLWTPMALNNKILTFITAPFLFAISAHIQFLKRFLDVFLSLKMGFQKEEIIGFLLPFFLFLSSSADLWKVFVTWNLIIMIGSFVFSLCSNLPHDQSGIEWIRKFQSENKAFHLPPRGHPKENQSVISYLNWYRGNVLHYLCPTIDTEGLDKLLPDFQETCNELGVFCDDSGFLQGCQNGLPQGHVFFS